MFLWQMNLFYNPPCVFARNTLERKKKCFARGSAKVKDQSGAELNSTEVGILCTEENLPGRGRTQPGLEICPQTALRTRSLCVFG